MDNQADRLSEICCRLVLYLGCDAGEPVIDRPPPAQRRVLVGLEWVSADAGVAATWTSATALRHELS